MKRAKKNHAGSGKCLRILFILLLILGVMGGAAIMIINGIVIGKVKDRMIPLTDASSLTDIDMILVLGCQVKKDGTPSRMLRERLTVAVDYYRAGVSDMILMSGDSQRRETYDEVNCMKKVAMDAGVPGENIFTDGYGLCTYDSVWRAAKLYGCKKILIVSQPYHLYRAVYIAEQLGMDAYGVSFEAEPGKGDFLREVREIAARVKDFFLCRSDSHTAAHGTEVWEHPGRLPDTLHAS